MTATKTAEIILVVEDDADTREALTDFLTLQGYEVVVAENGRRALEHLRSAAPNPCLILLDIMMPVMNGWEFLEAQQADHTLSAIPVIVLTADVTAQVKANGWPVAALLSKPVEIDALCDAVARHC